MYGSLRAKDGVTILSINNYSIRDQCQNAGVAFFFKQWGGVRRKLAGRQLDCREWNEMPAAYDLDRSRQDISTGASMKRL